MYVAGLQPQRIALAPEPRALPPRVSPGRSHERGAQFALGTPAARKRERRRITDGVGGNGKRADALGLLDEAALEHSVRSRLDAFVEHLERHVEKHEERVDAGG